MAVAMAKTKTEANTMTKKKTKTYVVLVEMADQKGKRRTFHPVSSLRSRYVAEGERR